MKANRLVGPGIAALAAGLVALGVSPATAQQQDERPNLPAWAPRWGKGMWWEVKTYQRDVTERLRSPGAAEGGMPVVPDDPFSEPLPGLPPLRDGVPEGWKAGNRFRFETVRRELVKYPGDEEGLTPEAFVVVAVRTLEGAPARSAELWYTESDLTLAKVVISPQSQGPRVHELSGTALLDPAVNQELGFPLDWPDFAAAKREERSRIEVEGRPTIEQRVRTNGEGAEQTAEVLLVEVTTRADAPRARARMAWKAGQHFWQRMVTATHMAELIGQGR